MERRRKLPKERRGERSFKSSRVNRKYFSLFAGIELAVRILVDLTTATFTSWIENFSGVFRLCTFAAVAHESA